MYYLLEEEELVLGSFADILEKAIRVSGKFGGVAGVLHGVIWKNKFYFISFDPKFNEI